MTVLAELPTGIIDVSNEEHHAIRALSNSGMKDLAVSPLRYWYHHINPAPKPDEEETVAKRVGSALHCAVLESDEVFESRYARALDPSDWPVCLDTIQDIRGWITDRGDKPGGTRKDVVIAQALDIMKRDGITVPILQEEQRRFFAQNADKTILHPDEWDRVAGMTMHLRAEVALRPILANGKAEQSLIARDPETGVLLKARLDWLAPKLTLDLKTFAQKRGKSIDQSVSDAIYYEGYYRQAYFYDLVRRLALGEDHDRIPFVIAFVESEQPHETRIKSLLPKTGSEPNLYWLMAQQECRALIRKYAECLDKFGDEPWRFGCAIEPLTDGDIRQLGY